MPITVNHVLTATTPDSTQEIRPSHWNSAHSVSVSLASNEVIKFFSAGTTSMSSGTLVFSNSNNLSFGLNAGTVTGSFSQSNQAVSFYASSNTTGVASSSTIDARSLSVRGMGNVSVGLSASELIISGAGGGVGVAAVGSTATSGTVSFSNSNNVSFGMNGQTVTATATFAQTNQTVGAYAVSNTTQSSSGTIDARSLSFQGAGIASVGVSNGSVIISVPSGGGAGDGGIGLSAGASSISSGNAIFSNSNGVSFGLNGSTVTASVASSLTNVNLSAGTTSNNLSAMVFSNSNGVSFGLNGSTVTASVALTSQSNQAASASNGSFTFQTLAFSNANGVTFGSSAGSIISASIATSLTNVNISAGTTSNNLSAVVFSNSNGVSFGLNGSTVTGSVAAQTNQTVGIYGISQTTGASSSSTYDARSLSFVGAGVISIGQSNGSVQISAPAAVDFTQLSVGNSNLGNTAGDTGVFTGQVILVGSNNITLSGSSNGNSVTLSIIGAAGGGGVAQSAGTQSVSTGTMVFSNSNNITFGMSGSSRITASYNFNVSGGTTSNNLNSIVFSNSNGVSFGLNGSTMTGSVATSLTNINVSGGTTSNNLSAVVFSNSNGVSFGLNGSTMTGSVATSLTNVNVSAGTTSNNLSAMVFSNSNGVSFGLNGSTVTGSVATSLSAVNLSAGTTSNNLSAFVFSNSNNVSFGLNGSTVTATATVAQTNQTVGLYALGNTTQNSSTTLDARTLSFNGLGIITAGYSNGSIQLSATQSAQTQSNVAGIYDGAASISTGTVRFSNSNGVSFGINGQTLTASVAAQTNQTVGMYALGNTTQNSSSTFDARTLSLNALGAMTAGYSNGSIQLSAPATSSLSATGQVSISTNGSTISIGVPNATTNTDGHNPYADQPMAVVQIGQGSLLFDPQSFPNIAFDRIVFPIYNTNSTLSSGSHTLSFYFGLYSRNVSTLSLVGSTSRSTAVTHSGTQGSYSLYSGMRNFTIGSTATVTAGKYWIGFASSTSSAGAGGSYSNVVLQGADTVFVTNATLSYGAIFGSSVNATNQLTLGQGFYTAATSGMPASVAFSQINGTASTANQQQIIMFANSTV